MHPAVERRYEHAYFTVEAALILPVAMLFTVMMIFMAFYSYDRCILEHSAYEAALRGAGCHTGTAADAQAQAAMAAGRLVEGKLFAVKDFSYDVRAEADSVTVRYRCTVDMPFLSWLGEYIADMNMAMEVSRSAGRLKPARTIRFCRMVNNQTGGLP